MSMMVLVMTINNDADAGDDAGAGADVDDDAGDDDQELICNEPSVRPAPSFHCTASTLHSVCRTVHNTHKLYSALVTHKL